MIWGRLARLRGSWAGSSEAGWWQNHEPAPSDPLQLGEAARRLLEDPVLQLALERIQTKLVEAWQNTPPGDSANREAHYRHYWALSEFRSELGRMIANAKVPRR